MAEEPSTPRPGDGTETHAVSPQNGDTARCASRSTSKLSRWQILVVLVGIGALAFLAYRALAPGDCGCGGDRRLTRDVQALTLTSKFAVLVLRYATDDIQDGQDSDRNGQAADRADLLSEHITSLKTGGYAFVSPSQVVAAVARKERLPSRAVVITFDEDRKAVLAPFLQTVVAHRVAAAVFVDPDGVGRPGNLTWQDLEGYWKLGVEVHCRLGAGERHLARPRELRQLLHRFSQRLDDPSAPSVAITGKIPSGSARQLLASGAAAVWLSSDQAVTPRSALFALPRWDVPLGLSGVTLPPMVAQMIATAQAKLEAPRTEARGQEHPR